MIIIWTERDLQLIKKLYEKYEQSEENVAELSKILKIFNRIYRETPKLCNGLLFIQLQIINFHYRDINGRLIKMVKKDMEMRMN